MRNCARVLFYFSDSSRINIRYTYGVHTRTRGGRVITGKCTTTYTGCAPLSAESYLTTDTDSNHEPRARDPSNQTSIRFTRVIWTPSSRAHLGCWNREEVNKLRHARALSHAHTPWNNVPLCARARATHFIVRIHWKYNASTYFAFRPPVAIK